MPFYSVSAFPPSLCSLLGASGSFMLVIGGAGTWLARLPRRSPSDVRLLPPPCHPPPSTLLPQEAWILANQKEPISMETTPLLWLATQLLVLEFFLLQRWPFSQRTILPLFADPWELPSGPGRGDGNGPRPLPLACWRRSGRVMAQPRGSGSQLRMWI